MSEEPGFWSCFWQTMRACVTNMACAPFFLAAILVYSFYYCWPYANSLPLHIDCVIADEDNSQLSRLITREFMAVPNYNIIGVFQNRAAAERLMNNNTAEAIIGIPAGFEENLASGVPTALTIVANGAFIVMAKMTMAGGSGPLSQIATATIQRELIRGGIPAASLEKQAATPLVTAVTMYNTNAGYLSFAIAIIFVVVFQAIMICGFCMLLNDWFLRKTMPGPLRMALRHPACLFAIQLPVFAITLFWCFFMEGWSFAWHEINAFKNPAATVTACVVYSLAISSLAACVGMAFNRSRFAIHAVVLSALPCFFVTGDLYPWQNIPEYIRALAWLFPSTPGVDAILRSSQTGATITEIFPYLLHLLFLACLYFALAWMLASIIRRKLEKSSLQQGEEQLVKESDTSAA